MLRPVLDFAACIVIFVATSTASALLFDIASLGPFGITLDLIQITNTDLTASGLLLLIVLLVLAPLYLGGKRRGLQAARLALAEGAQLTVVVPLIIYLLSEIVTDPSGPVAPWHPPIDSNSLRGAIASICAVAILGIVARAFPQIQYPLRLRSVKGIRARYYDAIRQLDSNALEDVRLRKRLHAIVDNVRKNRKKSRDSSRRLALVHFTSVTGSAPVYMLLFCCSFLGIAFITGLMVAARQTRYPVVFDSKPAMFAAAIYSEYLIGVCYDEKRGTYGRGFRYQRLDEKGSHFDIAQTVFYKGGRPVHLRLDPRHTCAEMGRSQPPIRTLSSATKVHRNRGAARGQ